ncbi:hypothetical protein J6590_061179 [Homalodisca vitripennis]|nr:hypothetical protein J6590_061179 [Homalodisca vitripennis]
MTKTSSRRLDKSALDQGLMDVVLARDRTPYEIKYLSNLREELRTKRENGERNLTIKYRNGIPTIVQKN